MAHALRRGRHRNHSNGSLNLGYVGVRLALSACSLGVACVKFGRKDVGRIYKGAEKISLPFLKHNI